MIDHCPMCGDWRYDGNCHTCITREAREVRRVAQAEREAQELHVAVMAINELSTIERYAA